MRDRVATGRKGGEVWDVFVIKLEDHPIETIVTAFVVGSKICRQLSKCVERNRPQCVDLLCPVNISGNESYFGMNTTKNRSIKWRKQTKDACTCARRQGTRFERSHRSCRTFLAVTFAKRGQGSEYFNASVVHLALPQHVRNQGPNGSFPKHEWDVVESLSSRLNIANILQ